MRYLTLLLSFIPSIAQADDWSRNDIYREALYLSLLTIDCQQTRFGARHQERFEEGNPLLGKHPSVGKINNICVATGISHVLIAGLLPEKWRYAFQGFSIIIETGIVGTNYSAGVKWGF